jgi:hypothetical protein
VDLQGRHRGEADGADEHADRGERARAVAVGVDAGERRGDQHPERQRDELDARRDRRVALGALVVEDEQEHQREAGQAVDERRGAGGGEQAVLERSSGRASARVSDARSATHSGSSTAAATSPAITIVSFQPLSPPRETPSTSPVRPTTNVVVPSTS